MKILDRYLVRQFSAPAFFCLLAFAMIFVIFDLFEHLAVFIRAHTPFAAIFQYYLWVLPALLVYLAPISLLLGLLYSLWQLTRHNELTAMRASGISWWRLAAPLAAFGLVAALAVGLINECLAPATSYRAAQFLIRQERSEDLSLRFAFDLPYKNERAHRIWAIHRFDLTTHEMRDVKVTQQREDGSDYETIQAAEARYYDGRWWFFDVMRQKYDMYNNPVGQVEKAPLVEMRELTETPRDFANEVKDPMFLSAWELLQFVRTHRQLSEKTCARYMVDFHTRLAMPWTCLAVIIFGIPFGWRAARQGAFSSILLALGTFFAFYIIMMLGQWFGKQQVLPPALSAWLPNLLFAGLGLFLIKRTH